MFWVDSLGNSVEFFGLTSPANVLQKRCANVHMTSLTDFPRKATVITTRTATIKVIKPTIARAERNKMRIKINMYVKLLLPVWLPGARSFSSLSLSLSLLEVNILWHFKRKICLTSGLCFLLPAPCTLHPALLFLARHLLYSHCCRHFLDSSCLSWWNACEKKIYHDEFVYTIWFAHVYGRQASYHASYNLSYCVSYLHHMELRSNQVGSQNFNLQYL